MNKYRMLLIACLILPLYMIISEPFLKLAWIGAAVAFIVPYGFFLLTMRTWDSTEIACGLVNPDQIRGHWQEPDDGSMNKYRILLIACLILPLYMIISEPFTKLVWIGAAVAFIVPYGFFWLAMRTWDTSGNCKNHPGGPTGKL